MRLSDRDRKCDLGSPVREICTPGSEWGDGYKGSCRLGEATASKGAAPVRLSKGYRPTAGPYQPQSRSRLDAALCRASHRRQTRRPPHPEMAEGGHYGARPVVRDGGRDASWARRSENDPLAARKLIHLGA